MCQGMGNQEWIAADLDNLGVVEVGRTFFDDGLNKSRIDILIQLEGVIIVPLFQPLRQFRTFGDLLEDFDRDFQRAGLAHMDEPVPEFGNALKRVVKIMRRDEDVRVDKVHVAP